MPKVETFDKTLVIEKATAVFHDKGYNATSMQDLVDATGLNRSSIYNSFQNKHNLFLACLSSYQAKYGKKTYELLSNEKSPLKSIFLIFELYLNEITSNTVDKGCLIVNCTGEMANHDLSITNFLKNNQDQMLAMLEDFVKKGQEQELINKKQLPKDYALYLFSFMQGFRTTGMLISDRTRLQSIINTVKQTLI